MSEVKAKKVNPFVDYLQESFQELKKVTWPTRNQAVRLTLLVLGFCFASAIVIGAMDALFNYGHQKLVDYAATVNPQEVVIPDTTTTTVPINAATKPVVNVGEETTAPATATTTPAPTTVPTALPAVTTPAPTPTSTQQ